jgi:hypothetical protein
MYKIEVDEKREIIIHKHTGLIELEEIGEFWKELLKMEEFVELGYNLLSDYRDCEFNFSDDLEGIVNFLEPLKDIVTGKREAVITTNPKTVALCSLFEFENYKINFKVKVFSTEDAALFWLKR